MQGLSPAPFNGSAPNLVIVENDKQGNPDYKQAFNTQACEQLNAWIGEYFTLSPLIQLDSAQIPSKILIQSLDSNQTENWTTAQTLGFLDFAQTESEWSPIGPSD
ncbi:hypothetical protein BDQ12DRAFT_725922 [Crucibulum laeve]|uniref:Uncharacterized protein n=1 Tax=Crucibulum laeve TaxID=68775 RepID=A0A5C3LS65_9AGAR|nr:hypothetical protein BDQ12DRAFT_725922 [Crucibulum laeve]